MDKAAIPKLALASHNMSIALALVREVQMHLQDPVLADVLADLVATLKNLDRAAMRISKK